MGDKPGRLHSDVVPEGLPRVRREVRRVPDRQLLPRTLDVARTVHIAKQTGPVIPIPQEAIDSLYNRYQNVYGQSTDDRR